MNNSSAGPSSKARVGASQPSESSLKRKRGMFQKDLQHMMYGFGDDSNPLPETVSLVEDIVVDDVTDMTISPEEDTMEKILAMMTNLCQKVEKIENEVQVLIETFKNQQHDGARR
ncbi:transcription initiation factor TFIID subunit 13 isoform X2 [Solanum lycopersicum]|uniref:transcription initiation factor TFIID subunit 13 isoform X2 n=1 Tax=Solanum lycopersicum TaxID=4081 RepID=UPI0002BCB39B|nr:transcription initiation factor TFIID subunit 13 isoform X2 [Solanum lycopersicum]